jgi:hypothetical protein
MPAPDHLRPCPACGVECLTPGIDLCPGCAADVAEAAALAGRTDNNVVQAWQGRCERCGCHLPCDCVVNAEHICDDEGAGLPAWDGEELPW